MLKMKFNYKNNDINNAIYPTILRDGIWTIRGRVDSRYSIKFNSIPRPY